MAGLMGGMSMGAPMGSAPAAPPGAFAPFQAWSKNGLTIMFACTKDPANASVTNIEASFTNGTPAPFEGLESIRINRKEASIQAVVPSKSSHLIRHLLAGELMPVIIRILRADAGRNPENWIDSVQDLSAYLGSRIKRALEKAQPVTISHFLFQDLTRYIEEVGEFWTLEIIEEIRKTIKSNLKKRDTLVSLTPVSHLVLSSGPREEQIQERFHHIYFEIRSLILDYSIHTTTVDSPDYRIADILEKLKL